MIQRLANYFGKLIYPDSLPPGVIKNIEEKAQAFNFREGDSVLKRGQVCTGAYFLVRGLARSYYEAGDKEITSRLMEEGFVITSWISYYTQGPAAECIVAMEDCDTIYFSKPDIEELCGVFPVVNNMVRKHLEYSFYHSELKAGILRLRTAMEKYIYFFENHPSLLRRVPLKHIASYLGMSEETLSRVRTKYHGQTKRKNLI